MMTLSDFDIQAYIDNELDWERAKIVMSQINDDPKLKSRYDDLLRQKHALQIWWEAIRRN